MLDQDKFETTVLLNYLRNLLLGKRMPQKMFAVICEWLTDNLENLIVGKIDARIWEALEEYTSAIKEYSGVRAGQKNLISEIVELLDTTVKFASDIASSPLQRSLTVLSDEMKFDEIDRKILSLIVRYKVREDFESLFDKFIGSGGNILHAISLFTGISKQCLSSHLSINSLLITSGFVQLKAGGYRRTDLTDRYDLPDSIADALIKTCDTTDDIRTHILGKPVKATLEWDDFAHLAQIRTSLFGFLKKSLHRQLPGINILLWGSPGTGKTEFCKTLATQIGCNLYAVGETDDDGDEPSRRERLDVLRLTQSLLQYQDNSLLMFDEMDDLFERSGLAALFGGKLQFSSKIFTNRLFENNPVPTLWIINDVAALDETIVRRMSLVLEIKSPPKSSRRGVWDRIVAKHQLDLPEQAIAELLDLEVSPAILDSAVRFAEINGKGTDDIIFATRGIVKAINGAKPQKQNHQGDYCPALVNADMNLNDLGTRLNQTGQRQFSLCLYGPPGTGKTEYVRQLAGQLGMEVLVKRASDLLGCHVGETEEKIAAAFQEAQENDSFLIFDEADSLLGDRQYAQRSWEISQVNEMLTWMESHPLPFACTTNLMDRLDQASLRRFTFKVGFSPLTYAQNSVAFKQFFGIAAPQTIDELASLTPGDFTVVRKKAEIMGVLDQPEELITMLTAEGSVKKTAANQIGFVANVSEERGL